MGQTRHTFVSNSTLWDGAFDKLETDLQTIESNYSGTSFPANPKTGQHCFRTDRGVNGLEYVYTGNPAVGESGWVESSILSAIGVEVIAARGSKSTLDQRFDVAFNEDGTLKAATTLYPSQWHLPSLTFTYYNATAFTVNGNQTDIYIATRRLKINLSASTVYSEVVSATYNSGPNTTTVVILHSVLDATLVSVEHSLFTPVGSNSALSQAMLAFLKATGAELLAGTDDAKFATAKALRDANVKMWKQTIGTFTATPASTSTLTMTADLTGSILVGMTLKYVIGGVTYYGMVAAITANILTVNGAPLSGSVTALYYDGGTIREFVVNIPGLYEDASNTGLIASDLCSNLTWRLRKSYLVYFSVWSKTHDSGAHGQASVRIDNTEVYTTAGGPSIALDANIYASGVNINTAAYDINFSEPIEITCVKGGNGDAQNLSVTMVFVTP